MAIGSVASLKQSVDVFSSNFKKLILKNKPINPVEFSSRFTTIAENYEKCNKVDLLYGNFRHFINYLVETKHDNLAGICYSILIKFNRGNFRNLETLAINALAIAKRFQDPIHIMARAEDLAEIYSKNAEGGSEHIKYLRLENKALKDICKNYNNPEFSKRFKTISRGLKPLTNYELLLCKVKLDIAKYTYKNAIVDAKNELEEAKKIFDKNKTNTNYSKKISELYSKIKEVEKLLTAG